MKQIVGVQILLQVLITIMLALIGATGWATERSMMRTVCYERVLHGERAVCPAAGPVERIVDGVVDFVAWSSK